MDFLDPKEKKLRSIRLMVGYVLMTVLIFTATLVLVYQAYGFGVDRKTGEVIQNGLVYVDSSPDNAVIFIDNVEKSDRTNTRMLLKAGNYQLTVKRDGYRDWSRKVEVLGGGIERITYPMLIQTNLAEQEIQNFGVNEQLIRTQSPDRRWLMVAKSGSLNTFTELDLKDAAKGTKLPLLRQIVFPETVFSATDKPRKLEVMEWSNDNEHFLVKHTFGDAYEYIILNRDRPETSFNINKLIERNPVKLTLRDKKFDHWHLQDSVGGDLIFATAKKEVSIVATAVTAYKSHDDSTLLYSKKSADGQQDVFLTREKDTKLLRKVKDGLLYLDIARFDGKWYVVVASDGDKRTYIYQDPWEVLSKVNGIKVAPKAIFRSNEPINTLEFSTNTRFVFVREGQHFAVYDSELDKIFNYNFSSELDKATEVSWMDGHRLLARSSGQTYIIDFDGSNKQQLVGAQPGDSTFFDRDYTVLYSFQDSKISTGSTALVETDLRYEQDK